MSDILTRVLDLPGVESSSGAVFSDDRRYRYMLWRAWDTTKGLLCFIGLNPSTADEEVNDPTITRMQKRALDGGYGGLVVVNIFALRSTDPRGLREVEQPIGENGPASNNTRLLEAARRSAAVVCGWGNHGGLRGREVLALLRKEGVNPLAYKINADGSPKHPLYVGYDVQPEPMP